MHYLGRLIWALFLPLSVLSAASFPPCTQSARSGYACELSFDWTASELPQSSSPYRDELMNVEFRSPEAKTYLVRAFWDGGNTLRVRFTPTQAGSWTYHVTSSIHRYSNHESTIAVAGSDAPGIVAVANLRHWRTSDKKPHLWLSAAAPFLAIDQAAFDAWLDARKHDGFTHIRGSLLTMNASAKPLDADGEPN